MGKREARRETIYGKTWAEVSEKLSEALSDRNKGLVFDADKQTVGEYLDRWLNDSVRGTVRTTTLVSVTRRSSGSSSGA